jgi:hypothetical protein
VLGKKVQRLQGRGKNPKGEKDMEERQNNDSNGKETERAYIEGEDLVIRIPWQSLNLRSPDGMAAVTDAMPVLGFPHNVLVMCVINVSLPDKTSIELLQARARRQRIQ